MLKKMSRVGKWMAAAVAVVGLTVAPLGAASAHGWYGGGPGGGWHGGGPGWHGGGPGWGGPRPGWGGGGGYYRHGGGYWSGGRWIAGALVTGAVAGLVYSAMQPRPYYPPPPPGYPGQTVVYEQPGTVVYQSAPVQTVTTTTTTRYVGDGY